jgi:proline dehydrogenase
MRGALLRFANHKLVRRIATGGVGRRVSLRFVAGEDLEDGLAVVKALNAKGMSASLDHLGENVSDAAAATEAARAYLAAIERIEAAGLNANISVKLTQLGLDIDREIALSNAADVIERARGAGTTVTFDMEDHRYTERTVDACLALQERFGGSVGLALQSYLYRTPADLERVLGVQVRLCKGAYLEPHSVALSAKEDVDGAYAHLARRLFGEVRAECRVEARARPGDIRVPAAVRRAP